MTSRFLRNLAALSFGVVLGGLLVIWSADASAAIWSNASGSVMIVRNSGGGSSVLRFPTTEYANTGAGAVAVSSGATAAIGSGLGAAVPVSLPVVVKQTLSPANIAGAIVGSGGSVPGAVLQLAAPLLVTAGLQYAEEKWNKVPTADETAATNAILINAPSGNVDTPRTITQYTVSSLSKVGAGATPQAACKSWYTALGNAAYSHTVEIQSGSDAYICAPTNTASSWRANAVPTYDACPAGTTNTPIWDSSNHMTLYCRGSGYICPSGQNWTREVTSTGTYCTRPACVGTEIRDTSDGLCKSAVLTTTEAVNRLTPAVTNYPDPASLVHAWPKDIDPDPNNTFPTPQVTGPSSVTSDTKSTTTNTPANGSTPASSTTTNTTTTVNNTYNNTTINTTITNTTTTIKDGVTVSTVTDGGTPDASKDDNAVVNDTAMPDLPKLYERKYPDGLVGVWNSGIGAIKSTPIFSLPQVFAPSGIETGTCPVWHMDLNIGKGMMYGVRDVSPPCSMWAFVKVVVIICALMAARALIFGG